MEKRKISAREAAFSSLMLCERDKKYSNLEIDAAIKKFALEGAEKGLYTTLVYGIIERKITLDHIISKLSSKPVSELDASVMTLLRLGLYQLIWLDRVPESAAVNETVNIAKKYTRAGGFVNAILRGFLREYGKDKLPYPDKSDITSYLSVRYSCGKDVVEILSRSVSDPEAVLAAFEETPDITLRVNTLKNTRDEVLEALEKEGVNGIPTENSPFGIRLTDKKLTPFAAKLIDEGKVFIQDEASQIAIIAASPKPGDTVIDACACPGGKSFSAAILMENRGKVMSFDLHKNKLSLIRGGAERLSIDIIETGERDGGKFFSELSESADLLICDAPCSGLGVIAKKPEIRYKSASEISRLPEVQYTILANCANYVKPGGVLCYTTCTINSHENKGVVKRFLSENDSFIPEDFTVGEISSRDGMVTLLPHIHKTDGFFITKLRKK